MFRDVGYTKIQYSNNTKTLYCHLDSVYYHYFNLIIE